MSLGLVLLLITATVAPLSFTQVQDALPNTAPLTLQGDIASVLVEGVDKFLLEQIAKESNSRARHWRRDLSSPSAYDKSIEPNRVRLRHILGLRDARVAPSAPQLSGFGTLGYLAKAKGFKVFRARWAAFGGVHGEGLWLEPTGKPRAFVVALPDADQSPEQIVGLAPGVALRSQFARRLAESGCRVLVPALISREMGRAKVEWTAAGSGLSNREFLYRSAFELGRQVTGYELQKIFAAIDWTSKESPGLRIGVVGYGEGGMLALYAGALDTRISATCVSGFFGPRERSWEEPLDRNIFGLLSGYGAAELASMVAPRSLVVEGATPPAVDLSGKGGGAPAKLTAATAAEVGDEFNRALALVKGLDREQFILENIGFPGRDTLGDPTLASFLIELAPGTKLGRASALPKSLAEPVVPADRAARQFREIDMHNQMLLARSGAVRAEFMKDLDTSSLAKYAASVEKYRDIFRKEVIGQFDEPLLPPNPRSRKSYTGEGWTGYEVVLDVFPGVIAYGILLLPDNIKSGERRPVVVCQHGLEGRPQDVIGKPGFDAYKSFAAKLAERGYITFAPQNLYIFTDRFRTLQRKANTIGKTLFSIIVPQHQQITDWLKTLPQVDASRIAFYGLSYGGKSAMRIPPLVSSYCLSICSADFNEWVWKNASTTSPYSYAFSGEYEIFEWDLGSTFNYAEMAALMAPRPFMVERGHFDGVVPDETVGYEFAKVRNLYEARLGIGDRCELEWFVGPHTINGKGTFEFLDRHLGFTPVSR